VLVTLGDIVFLYEGEDGPGGLVVGLAAKSDAWYLRRRSAWGRAECGAVAVGRTYLLPPPSSGGASLARPSLRFHTPLIEPDMQISRIRLSDKTSRLFACNAVCSL
jgi:hypothetical protein